MRRARRSGTRNVAATGSARKRRARRARAAPIEREPAIAVEVVETAAAQPGILARIAAWFAPS